MGIFSPIELVWKDQTFTIKPHRVMGMISSIEDVITMQELQAYCLRGSPPMAKLCMAYASALRYAGARVSDDEVYETAFAGEGSQIAVLEAVMNLMRLMLPPAARARMDAALAEGDEDKALEEADRGNSEAAPLKASSKKPTKRQSQKANG